MKYNAFCWACYMRGSAVGGAFSVESLYRICLINLALVQPWLACYSAYDLKTLIVCSVM